MLRLRSLLAWLSLAQLAWGSTPSCDAETTPPALIPLRVGTEWFLNPDHLPLVVALRRGFFREAGLEVDDPPPDPPPDPFPATPYPHPYPTPTHP